MKRLRLLYRWMALYAGIMCLVAAWRVLPLVYRVFGQGIACVLAGALFLAAMTCVEEFIKRNDP